MFQAELVAGAVATVTRDGNIVCEFDVPREAGEPGEEAIVIPERPLPCRAPGNG